VASRSLVSRCSSAPSSMRPHAAISSILPRLVVCVFARLAAAPPAARPRPRRGGCAQRSARFSLFARSAALAALRRGRGMAVPPSSPVSSCSPCFPDFGFLELPGSTVPSAPSLTGSPSIRAHLDGRSRRGDGGLHSACPKTAGRALELN
jgi:hypothetical protein